MGIVHKTVRHLIVGLLYQVEHFCKIQIHIRRKLNPVLVASLKNARHIVITVTNTLNLRNLTKFHLNGVLGIITQASISHFAQVGSNLHLHIVTDVLIFLHPLEQRGELI